MQMSIRYVSNDSLSLSFRVQETWCLSYQKAHIHNRVCPQLLHIRHSTLYPVYGKHPLYMFITYQLRMQSTTTAETKPQGEHKIDTKSVTKWMTTDRAEKED